MKPDFLVHKLLQTICRVLLVLLEPRADSSKETLKGYLAQCMSNPVRHTPSFLVIKFKTRPEQLSRCWRMGVQFVRGIWKCICSHLLDWEERSRFVLSFLLLPSDHNSNFFQQAYNDRLYSCLTTKQNKTKTCLRCTWEFQESAFICIADLKTANFF